MTIKDLYEYAVKKGLENSEVEIQYADSGGFYYGTRDLKEVVTIPKSEYKNDDLETEFLNNNPDAC